MFANFKITNQPFQNKMPGIHYSPVGRFLVQETFPKTLPRFVLILMERQQNQAFCVTAADWSNDHDLMNINLSDKLDNLYM